MLFNRPAVQEKETFLFLFFFYRVPVSLPSVRENGRSHVSSRICGNPGRTAAYSRIISG